MVFAGTLVHRGGANRSAVKALAADYENRIVARARERGARLPE